MKKILVLCLLALVATAPAHAQTKLFQASPMIKAATEKQWQASKVVTKGAWSTPVIPARLGSFRFSFQTTEIPKSRNPGLVGARPGQE